MQITPARSADGRQLLAPFCSLCMPRWSMQIISYLYGNSRLNIWSISCLTAVYLIYCNKTTHVTAPEASKPHACVLCASPNQMEAHPAAKAVERSPVRRSWCQTSHIAQKGIHSASPTSTTAPSRFSSCPVSALLGKGLL